jgi:hypothetical protein
LSTGSSLTRGECARFFLTGTPQYELKCIFNETQARLGDLLNVLFPDSPLRVRDEEHLPGEYGNPTNRFRIGYQPAQPPAESEPTSGSSTQTVKNSNHEASTTILPNENTL